MFTKFLCELVMGIQGVLVSFAQRWDEKNYWIKEVFYHSKPKAGKEDRSEE